MRVVFHKTNAAVLAAAEYLNGDQIIDPSAIGIFPAFNGAIHGTFTFDPAPSDLMVNFLSYQVDDPLAPTTVQLKNHIEIVLGATQMTADGKSTQTVTFNIKNPANVLQVGVNMTLAVTATGGFLASSTVAIVAGTGSMIFTSGLQTSSAIIYAQDSVLDPSTLIGGVIPLFSESVVFVPTPNVQSPLANVVPDISVVRTAKILFSDGVKFEDGMISTEHGVLSREYDTNDGTFTRYLAGAGGNNIQGIENTSMLQIWGANFRELFVRILTELDALGASYWIGLFNVSMFGAWTATPALSFGFRKFVADANIFAYVKDNAGTQQEVDTGVPMANGALFDFKISFDPTTNVITYFINGTQVASFIVSAGLTSSNYASLASLARNENGNAHPMDLGAVQLKYI